MRPNKFILSIVFFGVTSLFSILSSAAEKSATFPLRPIRWVIPNGPGGAADTLSRIVGGQLEDHLGKNVVIDDRPGANGIIGSDIVAKSTPDGYTWLTVYSGNHATNPSVYKRLPYDPLKDFRAIGTLAVVPYFVVAANNVPVKGLQDLVQLAKQNPKQLQYGVPTGSLNHLLAVMIQKMANVEMSQVPYKSAGVALTDTLAGRIQISFATTAAAGQLVKTGRVRGLAISSNSRSPLYPDIPTIAESGFPSFKVDVWFGVVVPSAIPNAIVQRISEAINAVLLEKKTLDRFSAVSAEVYRTKPQEFEKIIREDIKRWGDVVRSAGITAK